MLSYRLFKQVTQYLNIRWMLTGVAYLFTVISMALNMIQPLIISRLIDKVLVNREVDLLFPILGLSLGLAIIAGLLEVARDCLFRYLDICATLSLREVVLNHLRKISLTEIEKHGPGKFMPLLAGDTATLSGFINRTLVEMTIQCATMMLAVCMIFYMNWQMGFVALASIPVLMFIPRIFFKPLGQVSRLIRSHNEEIGTHLYECIQGSREIRAFGLENWEKKRFDTLYKGLIMTSTKETIFRSLTGQSSSLAISTIIILLYGFGSGQIGNGTLTIGMLVAAVQYFNSALRPIQAINNAAGDIKQSEVSLGKIEELLNIPVEEAEVDTDEASLTSDAVLAEALIKCRGLYVTCEGIEILSNINFNVEPGQIAAFVGPSGSGKTTLLKTMMGFMPVTEGELSMMGRSFCDWKRPALTKHVGMMFQESFIFAGTLYENIALGDLSATNDDVYAAACKAGLQSYVDSLPEGLQTRIGHQGFILSGGQRQRLAIARVILKRPNILILDEPTSALDRATEDQVLGELHEMMEGKTTLISTHRLETIQSADIIYVLDQGRIIDQGTHVELNGRCELYQRMFDNQLLQTPRADLTFIGG